MSNKEIHYNKARIFTIALFFFIIFAGVVLYERYKIEKPQFQITAIGLLTFVAIFYSLIFNNRFVLISKHVERGISDQLKSKKQEIRELTSKDQFEKAKKAIEDIDKIVGLKQMLDLKYWLFWSVLSLLASTIGLMTLNETWVWTAFAAFWMGLYGVVHIIIIWYYIYSRI